MSPNAMAPKPAQIPPPRQGLPPQIMTVLSWLVVILALISFAGGLVAAIAFISAIALEAPDVSERYVSLGSSVSLGTALLACLIALYAMNRENSPEHPAILRLPKSDAAKWYLILSIVFYLSGPTFLYIDIGFIRASAPLLGLAALFALSWAAKGVAKNNDRAFVLFLPLFSLMTIIGVVVITLAIAWL
ncbi:MAG: hypothetical protein JXA21_11755 [Anaerolineae bacterium]|nr:hypothetical protein [Anaerolineae bacterium]